MSTKRKRDLYVQSFQPGSELWQLCLNDDRNLNDIGLARFWISIEKELKLNKKKIRQNAIRVSFVI